LEKTELLECIVTTLREYYSPLVPASASIDLTMLRIIANGLGVKIAEVPTGPNVKFTLNDMVKKKPYWDMDDGICFPFTVRLQEAGSVYICYFGEPAKNTWYHKFLVLSKTKADAMPKSTFEIPDTD
jgi:hypothetical protein